MVKNTHKRATIVTSGVSICGRARFQLVAMGFNFERVTMGFQIGRGGIFGLSA
jgi:hypothetical protein